MPLAFAEHSATEAPSSRTLYSGGLRLRGAAEAAERSSMSINLIGLEGGSDRHGAETIHCRTGWIRRGNHWRRVQRSLPGEGVARQSCVFFPDRIDRT